MSKLKLDPIRSIMSKVYQTNWLIENFIEKQSLCMLFGEPSTYKSFMAMELAFCIGSGIDWYGNPTALGEVIYIAGEGASGIQKRIAALETKYGVTAKGIFVSSRPIEMTNPESVKEVLDIISQLAIQPALIIIDTLHRNFGEGDENSSRDVGLFVKHMDELKNATNATILTIHHSGHGEKGHSRGSSAIRASLDCEYQLKAKSDCTVELICKKMKEFDKPDVMEFELKPLQVTTASGTLDSAYLELATLGKPATNTRTQQLLQALNDATAAHGIPVANTLLLSMPQLSGKQCVPVQKWRQGAYSLMASEVPKQASRQAAFNRCRKTLIQNGLVIEENGYAVLV